MRDHPVCTERKQHINRSYLHRKLSNHALAATIAGVVWLAIYSVWSAPAQAEKPISGSGKIASPAKIAHGKALFEKLTCAGCHPRGENSLHPYRPLKGPGFLARYKEDGQIDHLIRTGVAKAGMPSFSKTQVSDKDMKDLIAYIRSLTK